MLSKTCSSTSLSAKSCRVQRWRPSGAGEHAAASNWASFCPSNFTCPGRLRGLRYRAALSPSSTKACRVRSTGAWFTPKLSPISASERRTPGASSACSRMRACVKVCAARRPVDTSFSSSWRSSGLNVTRYRLAGTLYLLAHERHFISSKDSAN
jgi:hypothetical protein